LQTLHPVAQERARRSVEMGAWPPANGDTEDGDDDEGRDLEPEPLPPHALEIIEYARHDFGIVLLPWVASFVDCVTPEVAREARAVFRELTGGETPPVDIAELSRRWRERVKPT